MATPFRRGDGVNGTAAIAPRRASSLGRIDRDASIPHAPRAAAQLFQDVLDDGVMSKFVARERSVKIQSERNPSRRLLQRDAEAGTN